MTSFSKDHFSTLLKYLGISFITGSISHGFFSGTRAAVLAGLGIVFFIVGTLISDEKKSDSYLKTILLSIGLAISIGMFTGGLQHFLDSPERSLLIVPLGFTLSLLFFAILHAYSFSKKEYFYVSISTIFIIVFSFGYFLFIQKNKIQPESHHQNTIIETIDPLASPNPSIITPTVSVESSQHGH